MEQYEKLFEQVFKHVDTALLHSVSLGSFRLPKSFYQTLSRLYPEEVLFASPLEETGDGMVTYRETIRDDLLTFLQGCPAFIHPGGEVLSLRTCIRLLATEVTEITEINQFSNPLCVLCTLCG